MVGEHIRALKDGRWNHAIDCGDETVIHLSEEATHPSRVRRSYRPEFVAGAAVVEVVTHRERTFPAAEVVARAYSRISDAGLSATFRDSEAFADWCVTGRLAAAVPNTVVPGVEAVTPAPSLPAAPRKAKASTAGKARRSVPAKGRRREARGKSSRAPAKRQAGARKAAKKKPAKKKAVRRGRAARRR